MDVIDYAITGAAAHRSRPGSLSSPTYLFLSMFPNCFLIKSGVTVEKVKAGIWPYTWDQ